MIVELCAWCGNEIGEEHACLEVRPRHAEHAEALAAALDADSSEQAAALAIAIYYLGGELLAETMAAADCGSEIARRALRLRAELRRLDDAGITGRREVH